MLIKIFSPSSPNIANGSEEGRMWCIPVTWGHWCFILDLCWEEGDTSSPSLAGRRRIFRITTPWWISTCPGWVSCCGQDVVQLWVQGWDPKMPLPHLSHFLRQPSHVPTELPITLPNQSRICGARSTGALGWRLGLVTNHCPTFWYGWPDLYNGASSHRAVYRAQAGCAPGCLTALSAPVVFLGSCFHDKIFSDSVFAHKPLKVCFCLMEELPLFGIQPAFK